MTQKISQRPVLSLISFYELASKGAVRHTKVARRSWPRSHKRALTQSCLREIHQQVNQQYTLREILTKEIQHPVDRERPVAICARILVAVVCRCDLSAIAGMRNSAKEIHLESHRDK